MLAGLTNFDELLIERVFQPLSHVLAARFGVARSSAAAFFVDIAALGWIVARGPGLARDVMAWHAATATLHLLLLLLGLTALTVLGSLFQRHAGLRHANPLRQTMRPHRAVLLILLLVRLAQFQEPALTECADLAMLAAAVVAVYLGACAERPPVRRDRLSPAPSAG